MSKMKIGTVAVAGCAAACVGVAVLPVLLGGVAAGGALAALEGEAAFVVLLALIGGGLYLWQSRRSKAACGCDPAAGCATDGASCALPKEQSPD